MGEDITETLEAVPRSWKVVHVFGFQNHCQQARPGAATGDHDRAREVHLPGLDLYNPARKPGRITEAACWAHGRRYLFKLADLAKAPLAIEAVRRIDAVFTIERDLNGLPTVERLVARARDVSPLVADLEDWIKAERSRLSRHADVAKAMDYMLKR